MSPGPKVQASATLRYVLAPDPAAADALRETAREYAAMLDIIGELAASAGSNLVTLHALAYEEVRKRTRLPSRLVTLGLRDFAARRAGEEVAGIPLDDKLYTIKSASELSISTVAGWWRRNSSASQASSIASRRSVSASAGVCPSRTPYRP